MGSYDPPNRPPLLKQLMLQLAITLVVAFLFSLQEDACFKMCFMASLIGGSIAAFSALYFNWRAFQFTLEQDCLNGEIAAHKILSDVQRANIGKILISGLLLIAVIQFGEAGIDKAKLIITYVFISIIGVGSNTYYLKNIEH